MSHLRWHPFFQTWVIVAEQRQDRTYHPPADLCPLCPTKSQDFQTEIPFPNYDIAVFENRFPSLAGQVPLAHQSGTLVLNDVPGSGICEVVCYSQDHEATLATLPLRQVQKLTRVWQDRWHALAERQEVEYIYIFENKGAEIGVTLSHPHGQIYGYPYIPLIPKLELQAEVDYKAHSGRNLWSDLIEHEVNTSQAERIIEQCDEFVAFVPSFARYPYEVVIAPITPFSNLASMAWRSLDALATVLHRVTRRYDALFGRSLPYIMAMHQEPVKSAFPETRFHVEFYPPNRTAEKLKYLAGSESGAGAFINDVLPEVAAQRLRSVIL